MVYTRHGAKHTTSLRSARVLIVSPRRVYQPTQKTLLCLENAGVCPLGELLSGAQICPSPSLQVCSLHGDGSSLLCGCLCQTGTQCH